MPFPSILKYSTANLLTVRPVEALFPQHYQEFFLLFTFQSPWSSFSKRISVFKKEFLQNQETISCHQVIQIFLLQSLQFIHKLTPHNLPKKLFDFSITSIFNDGTKITKEKVSAVLCNISQWNNKFGTMFPFEKVSQSEVYCMPKSFNNSLFIKGKETRTVQFQVQICKRSQCMTEQELRNFGSQEQILPKFVIAYPKMLLIPQQQSYINLTTVNQVIDIDPRYKDYFLNSQFEVHQHLINDQNLNIWPNMEFFNNKNNQTSRFQSVFKQNLKQTQIPLTLQFKKKEIINKYNRTIDKIQSFISQLGGILNIFYCIGLFLIAPYNKFLLSLDLQSQIQYADKERGFSVLQRSNFLIFLIQNFWKCFNEPTFTEQLNLIKKAAYQSQANNYLERIRILELSFQNFIEINFQTLIRIQDNHTYERLKQLQFRKQVHRKITEKEEMNFQESFFLSGIKLKLMKIKGPLKSRILDEMYRCEKVHPQSQVNLKKFKVQDEFSLQNNNFLK